MAAHDVDHAVLEPPAKRRRLSTDQSEMKAVDSADLAMSNPLPHNASSAEQKKEFEVGIQAFVNTKTELFEGTLKQRYSDFLVNEILPSGKVVHLRSTKAPKQKHNPSQPETSPSEAKAATNETKPPEAEVKEAELNGSNGRSREGQHAVVSLPEVIEADQSKLVEFLNEAAATDLLRLYQSIKDHPAKKPNEHPIVQTEFTTDRSIRSQIHQFIRETFKSTIESSTDHNGVLILTATKPDNRGKQQGNSWKGNQTRTQRPSKLGWADRGGEYCHFTLYKENKDTMEAVSWLTKQLRCNAKNFQFAGTKDRRAVTAQRCSAFRIEAERLAAQNLSLRGSKIGDFEYHTQGLELGDLGGNEFVITLRNCKIPGTQDRPQSLQAFKQDLDDRMRSLRENGYLNYYGQQRFGTFSMRTDTIGRHILKEDYEAACDGILAFQQDALEAAQQQQDDKTNIGQDDKYRALAIHTWRQEQTLNAALDILPRKFSAEAQLLRHLTRSPSDFLGALMQVQRNLRLMYVHAYQSHVWNMAATNRMRLYGSEVVQGDLVLVNEHKDKTDGAGDADSDQAMATDADGEQIIEPAGEDRAAEKDDVFERARPLTDEEARSGKYNIFDIVLPQPGYDILYPDNASGEYYKTFMLSIEGGELDPYNMRRKHREFSLSGSYRKILARIGQEFGVEVHRYERDDEQFVKTDMDLINEEKQARNDGKAQPVAVDENGTADAESGGNVAVVLRFQLGASQYATMALRELSKGGVAPYKPEFSGGR